MDSRSAPEWVGLRHRADERADVRGDGRSTETATAFPSPIESEATTVPGDYSVGLDYDDGRSPRAPDPRQPDPQESVSLAQTDPSATGSLKDLELVSQREDLELQYRSGAQRQSDSLEQRNEDGQHRGSLSATGHNINRGNSTEFSARTSGD